MTRIDYDMRKCNECGEVRNERGMSFVALPPDGNVWVCSECYSTATDRMQFEISLMEKSDNWIWADKVRRICAERDNAVENARVYAAMIERLAAAINEAVAGAFLAVEQRLAMEQGTLISRRVISGISSLMTPDATVALTDRDERVRREERERCAKLIAAHAEAVASSVLRGIPSPTAIETCDNIIAELREVG